MADKWVQVEPYKSIWLNKDTALFHYVDETENFSDDGFLTPELAFAALTKYVIEVLG